MTPRPATRSDIPALRRLHLENWRSAYADLIPPEALAAPAEAYMNAKWGTDALDQRQVLLIDDQGGLAGFAAFCDDTDGAVFLDNLHVSTPARGRGIARVLSHAVAKSAGPRAVWLTVLAANPALAIYLGWGGQPSDPFEATFLGTTVLEHKVIWPSGDALAGMLGRS